MNIDVLHIMLTLLALGLLALVVSGIHIRRQMEASLKGELLYTQERIRIVEQQRDSARDRSEQLYRELQQASKTPTSVVLGATGRVVPVDTSRHLSPVEATSTNRPQAHLLTRSQVSDAPPGYDYRRVHHDSGIMQGALLGSAVGYAAGASAVSSDDTCRTSSPSSPSYD